jgi:ferredoxin--NADP+ reductase
MANLRPETVIGTRHWNDRLFSFQTTRDSGFRFESGQFVMLGLEIAGRPLLRAYSIASASYAEHLEFFSIKVESGPLTSVLKEIRPGDPVLLGQKPTGTLLLDNLTPGRNLYLLATGTGLAPFLSLIQEPDIYERYERVIVVHGCRFRSELAYADFICRELGENELVGERVRGQLLYHASVTREPAPGQPRLTELLAGGRLASDLALTPLDPEADRLMLCGSMGMLDDMRAILTERGFTEGSHTGAGEFVYEKAFVG